VHRQPHGGRHTGKIVGHVVRVRRDALELPVNAGLFTREHLLPRIHAERSEQEGNGDADDARGRH
jgi:hypothetical protein